MIRKIFSVEQIRKADQFTIEQEPVSSINLMERAANECFLWLKKKANKDQEFVIFAGPGNNGGDGLAIARMLSEEGFKTKLFILSISNRFSDDFLVNKSRLVEQAKVELEEWNEFPSDFPDLSENAIIIDAIFGSGLSKPIEGWMAKLITKINEFSNIKVAIDIPSGLFADQISESRNPIFLADYTLSFQFPKFSFLFPENERFVGNWEILDIGLSNEYITHTVTSNYYLTHSFISSLWKPRAKFSHKGSFGHALIIAGDDSKMGAAVLCSKAAIKSGAGLVSLHHPKNAKGILPVAIPEVMSSMDENEECFGNVPDLTRFNSLAVGPGLGTRKQTARALKLLIQDWKNPMVIDADAINILAENKTWLYFLPPHSILTPHVKELDRLFGKSTNSFQRLEKTKIFAQKHQLFIIIKGAHTAIVSPNGNVYFNSTGNPGMASGGSGDVLSGILAGLLAQNYSPLNASLIAVYLHGLAGDFALEELGFESLIAGDIIHYLPKAFKSIYA